MNPGASTSNGNGSNAPIAMPHPWSSPPTQSGSSDDGSNGTDIERAVGSVTEACPVCGEQGIPVEPANLPRIGELRLDGWHSHQCDGTVYYHSQDQ